jgi:hypothetical protein
MDIIYMEVSMEHNEIMEILEKLRNSSYDDQCEKIKKYPVEIMELLAAKEYENVKEKFRIERFDILDNILFERVMKLNNDFEWTNENKQKFLNVNNKFMQVFDTAYNEAISIANVLEDRIQNDDGFIKDYEIEIKITPYLSDQFYDENLDGNSIGSILSEPEPHFSTINFSFGHYHFHHEKPIYLNKSLNWNIEYFGDVFKDNYICYEIHELLDTSRWSFYDIINIDKIWADVEVIHQHYY